MEFEGGIALELGAELSRIASNRYEMDPACRWEAGSSSRGFHLQGFDVLASVTEVKSEKARLLSRAMCDVWYASLSEVEAMVMDAGALPVTRGCLL